MASAYWPTEDPDRQYIEDRIRFWTFRLAGSSRRAAEYREDIAQDLRLDLLQRLRVFDPAKASRRTFIALIIEHRARSLREESRAAKRGYGRPNVSLHHEINPEADAPTELHEILSEDDYLRITRRAACSREATRDLAIDLKRAQARLTTLEVEVCRLLEDMTKKEAAAALGIPRTTLQDMVRRIGLKLVQAGLKESFE